MSINIPGFTPDLRSAQPSGLPSADRIAAALERIADALERAHAAYMDIEASNQPAKPCDDRTCTDRDHWAPFGRINHGDTPTTCTHGQDHPDTLACEYACAATMPGHRCTRAEHADDRHQWAMTDEEYDRRREEAGVPREVFDDVRAWADGREAAQRRLTAGCSDCEGECGQMDGSGAAGLNLNVQTACRETYADCTLCEPDIEYRCRLEDGHDGGHVWTKLADWEIELLGGVQTIKPNPLDESEARHDKANGTVVHDIKPCRRGYEHRDSDPCEYAPDPLDALGQIMTAIENGCDMVTASLGLASNPQKTAEAMRAAVTMLRETVMRYTDDTAPAKCALSEPHQGPHLWVSVVGQSLETGEPVPVSVTVRKVADPLDEDDHRPRHFPDGEHLRRYACGHWHMATRDRCNDPDHGDSHTLAWWDEPLTFCDCP